MTPQSRDFTPAKPEHHNTDEAGEKDPKKCMKMIETLIEVMRKYLKEMEEKTNKKFKKWRKRQTKYCKKQFI